MKRGISLIISGLGISVGILGIIGSTINFSNLSFILIVIFMIIFIASIVYLVATITVEEREKQGDIRVVKEHAINAIQGMDFTYEVIDEFPAEKVCMVSRLPLKQGREIVKCPHCDSYFIKDYLHDWVKNKKTCPVCQRLLVRLQVDEQKIDDQIKTQ